MKKFDDCIRLNDEIMLLKCQLDQMLDRKPLGAYEVIKLSEELDMLIAQYYDLRDDQSKLQISSIRK